MSWMVHDPVQHIGRTPKGSGECVALPVALCPSIPKSVAHWTRGTQVRGSSGLAPGTVIAIFNTNLDYQGSRFATVRDPNTKKSFGVAHTALYVGQTNLGIQVVHQNQT